MNYFVYIVCGKKSFIEELNFSLAFLKHFSRYPIIVLTDNTRNEININHDNIINVKTPSHLPDHQAHLYLETRALHYLKASKNDIFCYLDSDVIAINDKINHIFDEYTSPVNFAKDHCTIDYFSPNVMNCSCLSEFFQRTRQYHAMQSNFPSLSTSEKAAREWKTLLARFHDLKSRPHKHFLTIIKYLYFKHISNSSTFELNNLLFNKKNKCWYNRAGELIGYDMNYHNKKICKRYNVKYKHGQWFNKENKTIQPETANCHHLREYLNNQYNIAIPKNFHHWNGGVFLFSQQAKDFMDFWHKITFREIEKGMIKSYDDQASLIVTAYHFGIEDKIHLPGKYNFIADYGKKAIGYKPGKGFTDDTFTTFTEPSFLHVYHHWGDNDWIIWKYITNLATELSIEID